MKYDSASLASSSFNSMKNYSSSSSLDANRARMRTNHEIDYLDSDSYSGTGSPRAENPSAPIWNAAEEFQKPARPLTKQVNQLNYELPRSIYTRGNWSYAPEFIKVFSDLRVAEGGRAVLDCMLLGSPRPKVCWLFNDSKLQFGDVEVTDTADLCRLVVPRVSARHYGVYTVLAENEMGRAVTSATLLPIPYRYETNGVAI